MRPSVSFPLFKISLISFNMFERIFVEKDIADTPRAQGILKKFPTATVQYVDNHLAILKQADTEQRYLVLAHKKGDLVKGTPADYNLPGTHNFSIVHSYNCPYNCEYCYLQGYFRNRYLYLFLNYEDLATAIHATIATCPDAYFHLGEFSDALVLEHLSGLNAFLIPEMAKYPRATLEIRTKSTNIAPLQSLTPVANIVLSWSLNPAPLTARLEHGTPPLVDRLKALRTMAQAGWKTAIRLDPIVYHPGWEEEYTVFLKLLRCEIREINLHSVSVGLFRSNDKTRRAIQRRWPNSILYTEEIVSTADKLKYFLPIRREVYNTVVDRLVEWVPREKIFICMDPLP